MLADGIVSGIKTFANKQAKMKTQEAQAQRSNRH